MTNNKENHTVIKRRYLSSPFHLSSSKSNSSLTTSSLSPSSISTPHSKPNGFLSSVADGFATSIGFQAATRLFNSMFGNPTVNVVHQQQTVKEEITYEECDKLKDVLNSTNIESSVIREEFKKCEKKYNL
jgi:hypothetical protein